MKFKISTLYDDDISYEEEFIRYINYRFPKGDKRIYTDDDRCEVTIECEDMDESLFKLTIIMLFADIHIKSQLTSFSGLKPAIKRLYQSSLEEGKIICEKPYVTIIEYDPPGRGSKDVKLLDTEISALFVEETSRYDKLCGRRDLDMLKGNELTSYINQKTSITNKNICSGVIMADGKCTSIYDAALMLIYSLMFEVDDKDILAKLVSKIIDNVIIKNIDDEFAYYGTPELTFAINMEKDEESNGI